MTEEEAKDVVERIEYELGHHARVATRIEIHDLGLWARLEKASGAHYGVGLSGTTLFEKPVVLGPKCDASYTILYLP
ncbi:hypothetical protein [Pseudomonas sp. S32]|uniref:hypothetical protein n=1 Tax=Pseudomonas sp. S32 TaxID=2767448 RepID=UPI0019114880|nr:hypothetical protein [Pseudomonas sp. S32]MBK5003938.1 hypothetical protein [Pseudomonas sp. S32]